MNWLFLGFVVLSPGFGCACFMLDEQIAPFAKFCQKPGFLGHFIHLVGVSLGAINRYRKHCWAHFGIIFSEIGPPKRRVIKPC